MKFLLESVKHVEPDQVPKFLKEVLKALVEMKGADKVDEMMTRSGVTIQQLLPEKVTVTEFITSSVCTSSVSLNLSCIWTVPTLKIVIFVHIEANAKFHDIRI